MTSEEVEDFAKELVEYINKACGPKKKKAETAKMERCEQHVKGQGKSEDSAGNICAVSLGLNKMSDEEYNGFVAENVLVIAKAAREGDWKAAQWILEHLEPSTFAKTELKEPENK